MDEYRKYKDLKEKCEFVYKGIYLNLAAATTIWGLANNKDSLKLRSLARAFRVFVIPKNRYNFKIFALYGRYYRKDYFEEFNNVVGKLEGVHSCHIIKCKTKFVFSITNTLLVAKFFLFNKKIKDIPLIYRLIFISEIIEYCNFIDYYEKKNVEEIEKFVSMCSSQDYGNILSQFYHNKGVKTFSLLEGAGYIQRPCKTLDCLSYENFYSDKLLVWSNLTFQEYKNWGVPVGKMIIAGCAKDLKRAEMKSNNKYFKCILLLARESYRKSNMALLEILVNCKFSFDISLKLHPGSDFSFYKEYADNHNMKLIPEQKTINESINNEIYDFAIAVNTTAYYDVLVKGVPCFRYVDNTFQLVGGYDDKFSSIAEFEGKLKCVSELEIKEYQTIVNEILKNDMGIGVDNYREIILGSDK